VRHQQIAEARAARFGEIFRILTNKIRAPLLPTVPRTVRSCRRIAWHWTVKPPVFLL
jgi:hypothetical protein